MRARCSAARAPDVSPMVAASTFWVHRSRVMRSWVVWILPRRPAQTGIKLLYLRAPFCVLDSLLGTRSRGECRFKKQNNNNSRPRAPSEREWINSAAGALNKGRELYLRTRKVSGTRRSHDRRYVIRLWGTGVRPPLDGSANNAWVFDGAGRK